MRVRPSAAIALTLFFVLILPLGYASSLGPQYSLGVTNNSVSVSIGLNLSQNLTAYEKSFELPLLHGILEGSNSTELAHSIQDSIRTKQPQAHVSEVKVEVDSSAWSNTSGVQWFNISLTMKVADVSTSNGGVAKTDLSWKSFDVPSDITIGSVEINNIGAKLLARVATDLAAQTSSNPAIRLLFFIGDVQVGAPSFPELVYGIRTLSFARFRTPLSQWKETYDPLAQTTTWTLTPGVFLGMTFEQQTLEATRVTETLVYRLSAALNGKIVAPGNAYPNGDILTFPTNNVPEATMGVIIVSVLSILGGAATYERRLQARVIRKKPKR